MSLNYNSLYFVIKAKNWIPRISFRNRSINSVLRLESIIYEIHKTQTTYSNRMVICKKKKERKRNRDIKIDTRRMPVNNNDSKKLSLQRLQITIHLKLMWLEDTHRYTFTRYDHICLNWIYKLRELAIILRVEKIGLVIAD